MREDRSGREEAPSEWMKEALRFARDAYQKGEVPIGAVLVSDRGDYLGGGGNAVRRLHDPTAHAEVLALREAGQQLKNWRFPGSTLYVTVRPCLMCFSALLHAWVETVVFATPSLKRWPCLPKDGALALWNAWCTAPVSASPPHEERIGRMRLRPGSGGEEASELLRNFFSEKRLQPSCSIQSDEGR